MAVEFAVVEFAVVEFAQTYSSSLYISLLVCYPHTVDGLDCGSCRISTVVPLLAHFHLLAFTLIMVH